MIRLLRYLDYSNQDEMKATSLTAFIWLLVDGVTGHYQRATAAYITPGGIPISENIYIIAAIVSSPHQDEMEATYFDNFRLALPRWSDSSLPESDGYDVLLLEAFLSNVDTDAPMTQTASPCRFNLPKSDNVVKQAKCCEVF